MKLICCPHCKSDKIGPAHGLRVGSSPVMMGKWLGTSEFPVVFKCYHCTNVVRITAPEFHRLPEMTEAEVARYTEDAVN